MALARRVARAVNGGREARGRLGSSIDAERAALLRRRRLVLSTRRRAVLDAGQRPRGKRE